MHCSIQGVRHHEANRPIRYRCRNSMRFAQLKSDLAFRNSISGEGQTRARRNEVRPYPNQRNAARERSRYSIWMNTNLVGTTNRRPHLQSIATLALLG